MIFKKIFNSLVNLFRKSVPEYRDHVFTEYDRYGGYSSIQQLRNQLKASEQNGTLDKIKGVFQRVENEGMCYYIVRDWHDDHLSLVNVIIQNSPMGEIHACEIMDRDVFVDWAIDPWTGEINIDYE